MATFLRGMEDWSLEMDSDGHRDYRAVFRVRADDPMVGPFEVLSTSGLPAIGSTWNLGNDTDNYAWCRPNARVEPILKGEPNTEWRVEMLFSTKPMPRCNTASIEDPLMEPPKISGTFAKFTREATTDYQGKAFKTSSHELIRGPIVERDDNRPTVQIAMNVASSPLSTFASMVDGVNDATLWGCAPRCVKLSNVWWERNIYGTCSYFYTVTYDFEIDFSTFDRSTWDEGTMVLPEGLDPNTNDPDLPGSIPYKKSIARFVRYKDALGENGRVLLNGSGQPLASSDAPVTIPIKHYLEYDFLLLGIPSSL